MKQSAQKRIRAVLMRGGTSRGLYVMRNALPKDPERRDRVILRMFGSPDIRQIDGMGGADPLTSKLAIIGPPSRPDADVDYTFAQVSVAEPHVDYTGNCDNLAAGVGPFAIDERLVATREPVTQVRIHQTNTKAIIVAQVPVVNGRAAVEGEYHIDGVPGSGARIWLDFCNTEGSVFGRLLPTGNPVDELNVPGVGVVSLSFVDAGNPSVFVHAAALGLDGTETPAEIERDRSLMDRIERVRGTAAVRLGMVARWSHAASCTPHFPYLVLLSPAADAVNFTRGGLIPGDKVDFVARLLSTLKVHKAYPVTGTIATGAAAKIPGTIVWQAARPESARRARTVIGHPSGVIETDVVVQAQGTEYHLTQAMIGRTARRIMEGHVLVPWSLYRPARSVN